MKKSEKNKSVLIRQALKNGFYPFVKERGFIQGKASSIKTPFFRICGDIVHLFDIQWDKYGKPYFVINFGEAPANGIEIDGKHITADQIQKYGYAVGRLQRRIGGIRNRWFHLRKPVIEAMLTLQWNYTADELVSQIIKYFTELEIWWDTKQIGPHLDIVDEIRYRT